MRTVWCTADDRRAGARRDPARDRPAAAQDAQPSHPDLSGFWINQYTPDLSTVLGGEPPFTDFGAEQWRTVDTSKDPTASACRWGRHGPSPRRSRSSSCSGRHDRDPFRIPVDLAGVYLDGRPPSRGCRRVSVLHGPFGRPLGRQRAGRRHDRHRRAELARYRRPRHSAQLRLTERFERPAPTHIQWTVTFDDPVYFTGRGRSRARSRVASRPTGCCRTRATRTTRTWSTSSRSSRT